MDILFLNRSYWPDVEATGQLLTELCTDLARRHHVTVIAGRPNFVAASRKSPWLSREEHDGVEIIRVGNRPFDKKSFMSRVVGLSSYFADTGWAAYALPSPGRDRNGDWTRPCWERYCKLLKSWHRCPFVFYMQDLFPEVGLAMGRPGPRPLNRSSPRGNASGAEAGRPRRGVGRRHAAACTRPRHCSRQAGRNPQLVGPVRDPTDGRPKSLAAGVGRRRPAPRDVFGQSGPVAKPRPGAGSRQGVAGSAHPVRADRRRSGQSRVDEAGRIFKSRQRPLPALPTQREAGRVADGRGRSLDPAAPRPGRLHRAEQTRRTSMAGRLGIAAVDADSEVAAITAEANTGLRIEPDEAKPLAEALRWCLANRADLAAMGRRGRQHP